MKITLFIDKHIVWNKRYLALCYIIGLISGVSSYLNTPNTKTELYVEGIINEYRDDTRFRWVRGEGVCEIIRCYIIINDIMVHIPSKEERKFRDKGELYWKQLLEGKYAKIHYIKENKYILHIELEDGSYSYHDPHDISYYDVGWFPFCIFAPIALFCIFVLLRYFYLQTFASDERRILVFGNKDGNLH